MKIIKHGNGHLKVRLDPIAECPTCKCVFQFDRSEAKELPNNGGAYVYFMFCPECGDNNCAFDEGYPGNPLLNQVVLLRHKRLRALSETTNTP